MYDKGKIVPLLIVFLGLTTFPFWWNLASGTALAPPAAKTAAAGQHCVEPLADMRSSHMQLLNEWRDAVVRDGERVYHSKAYPGATYEMKKRERAGSWWFRLPGLTLLVVAFLLHILRARVGMAPFLETVASLVVISCFATGISCLLAVLPRRDPAPGEGVSVVVYRVLSSAGLVGLLGILAGWLG